MDHWFSALHTLLNLELRHELQEDVERKGEGHGRGGAETLKLRVMALSQANGGR